MVLSRDGLVEMAGSRFAPNRFEPSYGILHQFDFDAASAIQGFSHKALLAITEASIALAERGRIKDESTVGALIRELILDYFKGYNFASLLLRLGRLSDPSHSSFMRSSSCSMKGNESGSLFSSGKYFRTF